ncbi:glycosyltransferase family 39 protein [Pseudacidovorax sp. RU35E]|uniref:ArnT family glycosyltransferase n=1 Tax=Pseudacidovorax sp. RU35E TaxID=1907403 RepID=UPI00095679E4|nr:glycosyltransferase family 39 protein [Pseudacidovorax sp. RU35E]SIR59327.1 4-amino-4-deoxy-L-arabinose transferase [Pseudacidovorax sp. RU35E]
MSTAAPARGTASWWKGHAAFLLMVGMWLAWTAGLRPLTAPDEGRYAGVARAMLQSGDWLVPRLDGLPFFHKPPLFYWLAAAAMQVFGVHEWAARVPSVLGAWLAAASLYTFLRRHADLRLARWATLALCTSPFFFVGAQFANLDMLVAGCITATVACAADALRCLEEDRPWRSALALAFAAAALGLLAKGLIGLVLPGGVIVLWALLARRARVALRMAVWWPGWLLLIAIAGPWFVAMQLRYAEFFDYFVITQHFRRFADSGFNNEHPLWFYGPVLLGLCLPWTLWLLLWWRKPGPAPTRGTSGLPLLMLVWMGVVVVFFSLPRSKLVGYVLPALPPLAALVALGMARVLGASPRRGRVLGATGIAAALMCVGAVGLAAHLGTPPDSRLRLPAGQSVQPGDRVVMLDRYYYELPFYWQLHGPVVVAADWRPAVAQASDNWRKELADAGDFEPAAKSAWLQSIDAQPARICGPGRTWVIGPSNAQLVAPWVLGMQLVTFDAEIAVWRHDGRAGEAVDCLAGHATPGALPAWQGAS